MGTEVKDKKNLRIEIEKWVENVKKIFGSDALETDKTTPVKTYDKEPPEPCKPKNYASSAKQGNGDDQHVSQQQHRAKVKQEPQAQGRRTGAPTAAGQRNNNQAAPKSKLYSTPRLINFSSTYIKNQDGRGENVGKILRDIRTANNLDFPKAGEKSVCFPFLMELGCDDCFSHYGPRKNDLCSTHRAHISILQGGATSVTKSDLQPLFKYLQNEHVAKQLVPTEAFKKFMN